MFQPVLVSLRTAYSIFHFFISETLMSGLVLITATEDVCEVGTTGNKHIKKSEGNSHSTWTRIRPGRPDACQQLKRGCLVALPVPEHQVDSDKGSVNNWQRSSLVQSRSTSRGWKTWTPGERRLVQYPAWYNLPLKCYQQWDCSRGRGKWNWFVTQTFQ